MAGSDVDFGVLRMFEGLGADDVPVDLSVFRDRREATGWAFADPQSGMGGSP